MVWETPHFISLFAYSWGYSCCHSLVKFSYCTGVAGQEAERDADRYLVAAAESSDSPPGKSLVELHKERLAEKRKSKNKVTQEEMDRIREEKVSIFKLWFEFL